MNYKLISQCLDLAEDSVIVTEADSKGPSGPKILYVNKAFTKMTGYTYEEAVGKTPRILQCENTSREQLDKINHALRSGKHIRVELINCRKDGTEYWIELSISPIFNEKNYLEYFISVQKQIDERKQKENQLKQLVQELEDKVDSLNQINIATVHDLKEPIRSIHSFSQLLERNLENKLDQDSKDYISFIKTSSKRLNATINTLYHYSSIKRSAALVKVSIRQVIAEVCQNLHLKIKEKNATIEIFGNATILARESDILRLFQNLIDNSLKHSHAHIFPLIKIDISTKTETVEVLIEDNGIGIPLDFQPKIFKLFSKFNISSAEDSLGAGLAICKKIVSNNSGSIELLNSTDKGTTFILKFTRIGII